MKFLHVTEVADKSQQESYLCLGTICDSTGAKVKAIVEVKLMTILPSAVALF